MNPKGPRKKTAKKASKGTAPPRQFASRFALGVILWLLPVAVVWAVLTPYYNVILTRAAEDLVQITESPNKTTLTVTKRHYFLIYRSDKATAKGHVGSVRVTDVHFPLLMTGAFFLAVPGVAWKQRLEALGWALLISIGFHVLDLFFWIKFTYATQLGQWSLEQYGAFARNFWGLGKHLVDMPFKFSLPFVLWMAFYFRRLLPERQWPERQWPERQ